MFEWNETKRLKTLEERGLDFIDAIVVFDGRLAMHVPATHEGEERFLTVAKINGKFYTVVWMWREENQRIISFRRARNGEERAYCALHGS
jgi:uncharacterized DUF497 family protein